MPEAPHVLRTTIAHASLRLSYLTSPTRHTRPSIEIVERRRIGLPKFHDCGYPFVFMGHRLSDRRRFFVFFGIPEVMVMRRPHPHLILQIRPTWNSTDCRGARIAARLKICLDVSQKNSQNMFGLSLNFSLISS